MSNIGRCLYFSGITELGVEPYDEDQGTGELRYVQVVMLLNFLSYSSQKKKNGNN